MGVEGLTELLAKLHSLGEDGERIAAASVNAVADMVVEDAKESAPAAFGKIRQGIVTSPVSALEVAVVSTAPESPFQEFGTGGQVDVPEEMADVAAQFQGASGGGMAAFITSLVDWIKLRGLTNTYSVKTHRVSTKGTDEENTQLAWAIAKKILRDGLPPQPFLYPAFVAQGARLTPMLQEALQELLRSRQD